MTRIGLGLVGLGRHGIRYARHLAQEDVPGMRLVGAYRRDQKALEEETRSLGCKAYPDLETLLDDGEIDAVAVVVPPQHHPGLVGRVAAAGKAVLLEKPAALSVAAGREIQRHAENAGVPVMVAQTLRYNPAVLAMRRARDRIGAIHAVHVCQRFEPSPLGWVDDPALGGILFHTGVHSFDLVRYLTGAETTRAFCVTGKVDGAHADNQFAAVLHLDGGAGLVTVSGSRATGGRNGAVELVGEKGQLLGDHVFNTLYLARGRTSDPLEIPEDRPTVVETLRDFAGALGNDREMPIPLGEGLRAVAVAEASFRSAESGAAEAVTPVD